MLKNLFVYYSSSYKLSKKEIHQIVSLIKKELNFRIEFMEINFVTSGEIHEINKKYLNHNYSTDIITFNYSGENNTLDGEIFISLHDAYSNSLKYKVSLDNELLRLIVHGFLHLLGYDDKDVNDKRIMKRMENKLVKQIENLHKKIVLKYGPENS